MRTSSSGFPQAADDIRRELNSRGRRLTPQRAAILDALRSTTSHPTAEDLHATVQGSIPRISLGTVYRNLQVLVDEGYAIRLLAAHGSSRFDGNVDEHHHIVCVECQRFDDVHLEPDDATKRLVARRTGYRVIGQRTEFTGVCAACRAKEN